jgi:hypothetical protein
MKSKNELLSEFVKGCIHLSKKDYSFFSNLKIIIKDTNKITSNQAKLFDKLINKYQRQLKRQNCDINTLLNLEWINEVVESKQEYLQAKISLVNNNLLIKAPFNTNFVQNFRKVTINEFKWDSLNKLYVAPCSTYNLKLAITYVKKYYTDFVLCETLEELSKDTFQYQSEFWNPTLVESNGNFYITCLNEPLYEAIASIEKLNDDPKTLFNLSMYGIDISPSITESDPVKHFASNHKLSYELDNLDEIIKMLKLLEVEHVFTSRDVLYNKKIINEIKLKLLEEGITCSPLGTMSNKNSVIFTSNSAVSLSKKISKIIHLKNSRPINIS